MRGFIGLCLLVTGLSIGAYSHYPGAAHREASLVELTEIVTGAIQAEPISKAHAKGLRAATTDRHRIGPNRRHADVQIPKTDAILSTDSLKRRGWFANANLLSALKTSTETSKRVATAEQRHQAASKKPPVAARQKATPTGALRQVAAPGLQPRAKSITGWRTAVVSVRSAPKASLTPTTKAERWQLAKDIQRELKRVGCYWGKIDGVWGKGSKRAIAEFFQAVNAALPSHDPDYIQLQLISAHRSQICGRTPQGTQIAMQVKRVPSEANRAGQRLETGSLQTSQSPTGQQQRRKAHLPGRMAIGALDRDHQRPELIAAPRRITRAMVEERQGQERGVRQKRTLQITALPNSRGYELRRTDNIDPRQRSANLEPASLDRAAIATPRPSRKIERARLLRKAKKAKKKRRRYSRRYRRRSLQNMFMYPLGRR